MSLTLRKVKNEIRRMDPNCGDGEDFKTAVVLLSSLETGPDSDALATFTGYPRKFVREIGGRLRDSGIWKNGKVYAGDWFDKDGGLAFWLDVAVGRGFMRRVPGKRSSTRKPEERKDV